MTTIKALSQITINKIAAGQVVEDPTSVVKELLENSFDAKSDSITVELEAGGRNLIRVTDNGLGISKENLPYAIQRHSTSKVDNDDLLNLRYFGFRGEALASIISVAKVRIKSRYLESEEAWELISHTATAHHDDAAIKIIPAARKVGTTIEIRDLFCFTPTRLKFLRSEKSEVKSIIELMMRFALVYRNTTLSLMVDSKPRFTFSPSPECDEHNFIQLLGEDFMNNALTVEEKNIVGSVTGYACLPTYNQYNSASQYIFVNNRIVKDKIIALMIRNIYQNLLPSGRHGAAILFLNIHSDYVDVNVHPKKTEVRFRDIESVKKLVYHAINNAIENSGPQVASTVAKNAMRTHSKEASMHDEQFHAINSWQSKAQVHKSLRYAREQQQNKLDLLFSANHRAQTSLYQDNNLNNQSTYNLHEKPNADYIKDNVTNIQHFNNNAVQQYNYNENNRKSINMGIAKCQIESSYIVVECEDGLIIVDQHAAHERIVLERLKKDSQLGILQSQAFIMPLEIELSLPLLESLIMHVESLKKYAIHITQKNKNTILLHSFPTILCNSKKNIDSVIKDVAGSLYERNDLSSLDNTIEYILGEIACHTSIQAGQQLSVEEMNAILRQMESTPRAAQCNHGRPAYARFSSKDLRKMFQRP